MEMRKIEGRKIQSRARWRLFGDKLSANFFNAVKEAPNTSSITELRDSQGILHHDRSMIELLCTEFYTKLYTTESVTAEILSDRDAIFSCVNNHFTPFMTQQLEGPLIEQELHHAMRASAVVARYRYN